MQLLPDDLVQAWAGQPDLRASALRWGWFDIAFHAAIDALNAVESGAPTDAVVLDDKSPASIDDDALATAFFAWSAAVDEVAHHEPLDPLDFRHFIAGLLLRQLLTGKPPVLIRTGAVQTASRANGAALLAFVLGLLQAWRLNAGLPPLTLAPQATDDRWLAGFLENVRENSANAISGLDLLTGREPVWQGATLIESRPAIRQALAR